ncbi:hypothetical protein BJX96DRAFT_159771 [Aspergillus floccosus]
MAPSAFMLLCLSVLGLDAIYGFGFRNGFLELMANSYRGRKLSGTAEPLRGNITGTGFDELLGNLIVFYWPVLDGNHPGVSLQAFHFLGAIVAVWVAIQIQSWRSPNRNSLLLSPTLFAMLSQVVAIAVVVPLWCAIHIWSSSSPSRPMTRTISDSAVHSIRLIPISMLLGFGVPTIAMLVPDNPHQGFFDKQIAIAVWQIWPIYVALCHWALRVLTGPRRNKSISVRTACREAYTFAFVCAIIPHAVSWGLSLTLIPTNLLADVSPWQFAGGDTVQVQSMAQGGLWFLQWDHLIGMGSFLLWAMHMRWTDDKGPSFLQTCYLALKVGVLCLISGLCGAAVWLLWEESQS